MWPDGRSLSKIDSCCGVPEASLIDLLWPTWCSPTAALQLRPSLTGYGFSAGETSRPNGQTCFGVHNFHGERRAPGQTGGESEESRLSPARQRPWSGTLDQVAFARIC